MKKKLVYGIILLFVSSGFLISSISTIPGAIFSMVCFIFLTFPGMLVFNEYLSKRFSVNNAEEEIMLGTKAR